MTYSKLVLFFVTFTSASLAHAGTCYRAEVGPSDVLNLKGPAELIFLEDSRPRQIGAMTLKGSGVDAAEDVYWTPGRPIVYSIGDSGTFELGSADGKTTLNVRDGMLRLAWTDGDAKTRERVLRIQRSSELRPIETHIYPLTMLDEATCRRLFPE